MYGKYFFPHLENKAALWWNIFSSGIEHWTSILTYNHLTSTFSFCTTPTTVKFKASMKTLGYLLKYEQPNCLSEQSQNQRKIEKQPFLLVTITRLLERKKKLLCCETLYSSHRRSSHFWFCGFSSFALFFFSKSLLDIS